MARALLDINVLLALLDADHEFWACDRRVLGSGFATPDRV